MKKIKFLLLALFAAVFFSGCEAIEEALNINLTDDVPHYQISLHSIIKYPRGNAIEEEIDTFKGEKLVINKNSFLINNIKSLL